MDAWQEEVCVDSRFTTLLQLGNLAILDFKGLILAANDAFCKMLGYEAGELTGKRVLDLTYPGDHDLGRALIRQAMAGDIKSYNIEKRYVRKNGTHFWALLTGSVICDTRTNEPQFFASLIQDIDARKKAELALAVNESRWNFALESAGQGVWDCRVAENKTFYSETWKAMLGYGGDEISDATDAWKSFVHPEDLPRALAADRDHLAGLTPYFECEFRMRHKQGHWVWILDKAKVIERDEQGAPLRMIGTHTDITAIKSSGELLNKTGERYRLLADNSTDMIMIVRKSGRRVYVSPSCRRLLGFEPEEMAKIPTAEALHPDDVAILTERWIERFESEEATTLIYRMRRSDGGYIWVESISRALPTETGQAPERLLVVRDIDQRVAAEQRLKESEERYRLLAEYSTDMVFQLDRDLVRRYVSPAAREILGYEPNELLGIVPSSMAHPEDAPMVAGVFKALIEGTLERGSLTNRIRHRDGRWIWVDAELRLLRDYRTGAPSGILGSLRDASKRKEKEARLEESNRALASEAVRDGLTGLFNRRAFDEALDREYRRSRREQSPFALLMIDVDHFKAFNDRYGHPAGDVCLRSVSRAIKGALRRGGDLAARYGGEEFAVLLPGVSEEGAVKVAERIRQAVKNLKIEHAGAFVQHVTISAGAAATLTGARAKKFDIVVQADRALYTAKRAGRDAVCAATHTLRSEAERELRPEGERNPPMSAVDARPGSAF